MSDDNERRLEDLEIRLMHQEDALDTVTDTLLRQQRVIDRLHQQNEQLQKRLRGLEEQQSGDEEEQQSPEPPPPHY